MCIRYGWYGGFCRHLVGERCGCVRDTCTRTVDGFSRIRRRGEKRSRVATVWPHAMHPKQAGILIVWATGMLERTTVCNTDKRNKAPSGQSKFHVINVRLSYWYYIHICDHKSNKNYPNPTSRTKLTNLARVYYPGSLLSAAVRELPRPLHVLGGRDIGSPSAADSRVSARTTRTAIGFSDEVVASPGTNSGSSTRMACRSWIAAVESPAFEGYEKGPPPSELPKSSMLRLRCRIFQNIHIVRRQP